MRILLLQARNHGDAAKIAERKSFAKKAGIPEEQIVSHDLLQGPPDLSKVKASDALMIGGSGEYYVSKQNLPRLQAQLDFLIEVVEAGHPTFASCFGFQLLVQALGGEIIFDEAQMEIGTHEVTLTEAGKNDPLFGQLPDSFYAQLGRKDRAMRLPPNAAHLAVSARCPYQALKIADKPIWATQFHPEMNGEENKSRFKNYMDKYCGHLQDEEKKELLAGFRESRETKTLLPRFLELIRQF